MKSDSMLSLVRTSLVVVALGLFGTNAPAAGKPAPQVSISLRGVAGQSLEQGESWRVVVRLELPRGSKETLELAPEAGTWADAIAVELYPASGNTVAARAEAAGKPETKKATLDAQHIAGGLWRFSTEAMQSVAPGNYVLRVRLAIAVGSGWTGVVAAREIPFTVVVPATKRSVQRIANQAQDFLLTDKVQEAAVLVDAELKNAPRDYTLLKVRALVAEKAGNPFAATMCLNAANFSTVKKTAGQPAAEDREMLARFEQFRKTASPNPPAWSWPPVEVLLALTQEAMNSGFIPPTPAERAAGARIETAPAVVTPASPPPIRSESGPASPTPTSPRVSVAPAAPLLREAGKIVPASELNDAKVAADPSGQWAVSAIAGTQYGRTQYSAAQATGAPNISVAGNSPEAWCPEKKDDGTDWLEVAFAQPVHASEVRVRQNNAPGAISRIEVIESDGTAHVWWEGVDPSSRSVGREIVWFAVRVPRTAYLVARVKITLNLAAVPDWKEIDAVQLVGAMP